ncbi:S41 family peptidase [Mucilaginibacter sp.]|uniref:S41 family peptidase n=1 Tax=Mucilaginibacter sp. TaxID=1882438 RepID=UPI0025E0E65E|nr:S41 family peptidase [Mucilaginibacter sp.]
MKKIFYLILVVAAVAVSSCKKNSKGSGGTTPTDPTQPSKTGTVIQLAQDSIWLYAKEAYLWNDQLPTYATFKPRSFTNAAPLTALSNELDALSQYAINPATNKPYEYYKYDPGRAKYSFIDDGTETGALNGTKGDFGFDYNYQAVNDVRIVYVYPGSPAGLAGLRRGYEIMSVNNNTKLSYDGVSGGTTYGDGSGTNINFLYNSVFNSGNIKMTVKKPDGSTFDVNFAAANYNVNPVLKDTVLDLGSGKKLGYFVFNSFTSDANADPKLDAVFAKFTAAGVTDVAVDLRYNGGGYVSTAEYIDNYLVPTAKNNTLMYNTYFNSILSSNSETLLKNQVRKDNTGALYNLSQIDYSLNSPYNTPKFAKMGNLNVGRVFFIITGGTASASELTINNLRPVLDVELVGETSYGKPVGFFDIGINKYTMFTPEFSTKNSANQGDYFDGFTPGTTGLPGVNDFDDYTKDFGDPTEKLLGHIISKITTNTYGVTTKVIQSVDPAKRTFSLAESRDKTMLLNKSKFTGMLFNFKKVQLKPKK